MPEKDYSHRSVEDKLGVKPGQALVIHDPLALVDSGLTDRIVERLGRPFAEPDETLDVALVSVRNGDDFLAVLQHWRARLDSAGGVWLLSPKRREPGYVDQSVFIEVGPEAGLVDNKVCSVSEAVSAMRFVIPRGARPRSG